MPDLSVEQIISRVLTSKHRYGSLQDNQSHFYNYQLQQQNNFLTSKLNRLRQQYSKISKQRLQKTHIQQQISRLKSGISQVSKNNQKLTAKVQKARLSNVVLKQSKYQIQEPDCCHRLSAYTCSHAVLQLQHQQSRSKAKSAISPAPVSSISMWREGKDQYSQCDLESQYLKEQLSELHSYEEQLQKILKNQERVIKQYKEALATEDVITKRLCRGNSKLGWSAGTIVKMENYRGQQVRRALN